VDLKRKVLTISKSESQGIRHSYCSHLAMAGAASRPNHDLAGHADLTMTMRYMHLSPGAREEAVRLLERKSAEAVQEAEKREVDGDQTETAGFSC
jgi:site-specific recombinase XerD